MASYPDGTIFESAQTFPAFTTFGAACLFPDGCVFLNPCYFGDGCVFGVVRLSYDEPRRPPHETGTGCSFAPGSIIRYVRIGEANIIQDPDTYEPVSQGPDTLVGNQHHKEWPGEATATVCARCGQVVSGDKVSHDWCGASTITGFDVGDATVKHTDYCIGE
jgi:hypothetical protein